MAVRTGGACLSGCLEPVVGDVSVRPGTFDAVGAGILFPDAQDAPGRGDTHPAAWNVPVGQPRCVGDVPPYRATSGIDACRSSVTAEARSTTAGGTFTRERPSFKVTWSGAPVMTR